MVHKVHRQRPLGTEPTEGEQMQVPARAPHSLQGLCPLREVAAQMPIYRAAWLFKGPPSLDCLGSNPGPTTLQLCVSRQLPGLCVCFLICEMGILPPSLIVY